MSDWTIYSCLWLGFASAMVAGVFQSFSDFVMAGLARAKPDGGIETMQHINRTVFRSVFLTTFLSLVPLTVAFALYAWSNMAGAGRAFIVAAGLVYLTTVFFVTMAGNVPMNRKLDRMDYASEESAAYWQVYARDWTRWNHVRTVGAAATAALFLLAVSVSLTVT